jgi:hypothetical protein
LNDPDALMPPVSVAEAYWQLYQQPRSAWTFEMEVRPNFAEYPMTTTGMPSYTTEGRIYAK